MTTPESSRVSVCVPCYKGAEYLPSSLGSIVAQKGVQVEVVLLDDQSPDDSVAVARAVAEQWPQVDWVIEVNAQRQGMVGNWNACLERCTGDFVKVIGQDDLLAPGCLQRQVEALNAHPEAALCACDCQIYSRRGRSLFHRRKGWATGLLAADEVIQRCLQRAVNPLGEPVAVLARREDYQSGGGYDAALEYYVDVEKCLRLMGERPAFFIAEPLAGFRVHRGAASFRLQGDAYREFLEIERRFRQPHFPPLGGGRRCLRQGQAFLDSILRLVFYRIWG